MAGTSIGGVLVGLFLALLGVAGIVAGGAVVAETTFAEGGESKTEHGPMGLFGESESREATVNLEPVLGLLLALGGLAAAITGFVLTSRSFERGKDRASDPGSSP